MNCHSIKTGLVLLFSSLIITCPLNSQVSDASKRIDLDVNHNMILGESPSENTIEITAPDILKKISEDKFLVIECQQNEKVSGIIHLEFFKKDNSDDGIADHPSLSSKIGLLPYLRTYMVFPFSYLDGQQIFIPRYPRQMKGVVFGNRIDFDDLGKIKIYAASATKEEGIRIFKGFITDKLPDFDKIPETEVVDNYGQWMAKDWKNKINSQTEWNEHFDNLEKMAKADAQHSEEFSEFGGWKELRFDSTGYFHTHHDGKRWWFVDPHGYAFLSIGMDVITPGVPGVLEGNEKLYTYIPEKSGLMKDAFGETRNMEMLDFFRVNLINAFGEDWRTQWTAITKNKLISANFNTIGNWAEKRFMTRADMPYVLPMNNFPQTDVKLYRDFPDVFSPEYRRKAVKFASQLKKYKDDPYLIGYFLRNEPQWAFGEKNIAFEMLATDKFSYTRAVLALWLQEKYVNIDSLSSHWDMEFDSFVDILNLTLKDYPSDSCRSDLWEFSKHMVKKYVDVISEETRKVDPNHLNLGMRYAYISSELLYVAGESFDVFSINGYHAPGPPETKEIYEKSGKPVLIGEFHFGATDRGLPSTGLRAVKNQKHRGIAYRCYLEQGFQRPEMIGIHYFQWMDQPIMGRFDGENYNIGFNDILYQSYEELYKQAKKAHLNVYPVATGEKTPFGKEPKETKAIAF